MVIGPLAGVAVDRWDRLRLLWVVNGIRAFVVGALLIALLTGHASIGLLILAAVLLGVGETFVDTTAQALVPRLVVPEQVERANGRIYGAQVVTNQFLGQGITGLLFAWAVVAPFALDAAMLAVATLAALGLATSSTPAPGPAGGPPAAGPVPASREITSRRGRWTAALGGAVTDTAASGRWLLHHPLMRGLWLMIAALGFASGAFWGAIALYAADVLRLDPAGSASCSPSARLAPCWAANWLRRCATGSAPPAPSTWRSP